ncbi:MAG: nucleotidyltransferase domain-containing protein [Phycisphaerae bacterium]|nr:nucleotidyltransferase domain-containing protein [Phycisphaerae bacterium]
MRKGTLELSDELRRQIRDSLKELHPEKVIVFGSYAQGEADQDSDIDLIVILDSEAVPTTYRDRMMNRLLVRRALDALNRDYALDVLVYTAPEWKRFQDSGSAFAREIASQGVEV